MVKYVVKTGLYGYHKKIVISGLENIPKDKPVLFLPNHQSALIDILLIATDCNRKPFFLTRSDVFNGKFLKRVFSYFQMLPIYRMRDGRETLTNNSFIFDTCAEILNDGNAIVIFPEANHNLQRRVRPLSKGFTRIIMRSFELYPNLDIQLVPVGLNYKNAVHFPDQVAVRYGKPISAKSLFNVKAINQSSQIIKDSVALALKELTTHIENEYDLTLNRLMNDKVNFLNPSEVNKTILSYSQQQQHIEIIPVDQEKTDFFKLLFEVLNFPIVTLWRLWLKPKVPEAEFMGTFRFALAFICYPIYLLTIFLILFYFFPLALALVITGLLTFLNVFLVKYVLR
ncbi:hypothetical protein A9200_09125 [Maribacter hydrothermalis]|uniref:Phospholipid/glycerol acyltransferase domain-containing protein n=1 Tax=Maribacter hydrothermalis TaxID=1836467 RepID=A0A1B7Z234_9FLAO|nr:hypothetical protein BTR34_13235 [Maribacter hydrothermalis]OBR36748.1 hypothetical protein A9200_09125 [Maribacter hydrothermalis]